MKKILYLIPAFVILLLQSCYNGEYVLENRMLGDIKTEPAVINGDYIALRGNHDGLDSDMICFQIGRTSDFSGQSISLKPNDESDLILPRYELGGQYFYRLGIVAGNDTIYAPNVESFSVDMTLHMDSVEMLNPFVGLLCVESNVILDEKLLYWLVSTDDSFYNAERYGYITDRWSSDGHYFYQGSADYFSSGKTFYVKACVDVLLGPVESDVLSFTTEENKLESVTIYGNDQNGQTIKDDLKILIKNLTTEKWVKPYTAVYDESIRNYVINDFDFILEPDTYYAVYAVSGETIWDDSGYVTFSKDKYNTGFNQTPIYWGVSEIGGTLNYLKLGLQEWTSRLTITYPVEWGIVNNILLYNEKRGLPGNAFYIQDRKGLSNAYAYYGASENGCILSNDGSQYSFTFNIFPTALVSEYCKITIPSPYGERQLVCPDLKIESGRNYLINITQKDLGVEDVTVTEWQPTEGGSIIINPNK